MGMYPILGGTVSLTDDILDFNTDKYVPYTSKPVGLGFYTGTENPDGTTRINLNGDFWPTMINISSGSNTGLYVQNISSSGAGLLIQTRSGKPLEIDFAGNLTGNLNTNMFDISRISAGGSYNITGNIINITDNPTSSGTISGKVLSATIGATERISLNPRIADGSNVIAYLFDTHNNLTIDTSKISEYRNQGVQKSAIFWDGRYGFKAGTSSVLAIAPGILKDFYTDITTSGTAETDLYSYTVPANVLATNGDKIIAQFITFDISGGTNSYLRFYFAGWSKVIAGATGITGPAIINVTIIRVSSSVARLCIDASYNGGTPFKWYEEITSKDWTTSNILKITGECATGVITARAGYIEYKPAAVN